MSEVFALLDQIDHPADLRKLSEEQLPQLAQELRDFLIGSVASTGGHLAAGLGVVELTIALHYIYNTPEDRLVWDVGHQSYPHKILTGRRQRMATLRQAGGLSGFPKRSESEYDSFGVGHSSTSISAALGMLVAAKQLGQPRRAIAVIGDGAMTAGMAFEALNDASHQDLDLLVILNDNVMSISENVGGLSRYTAKLLAGRFYNQLKASGKKVLKHMPAMLDLARRAETHMKGMVVPGTLFEELGFNYVGPIDGHDMQGLVRTLHNLRERRGPQLLHIMTQKGKGYAPAEADPCGYHGVSRFDPQVGKVASKAGSPSYSDIFGHWLCDMATADPRLLAITPAMTEGSGMVEYSKRFPERFYDVGIAEQHAITLAAGMACEGARPVVAIYSTFLQRGYDQLIHDVCLQNLPVLFAIDRAGIVGADGPSHAGSFDLSFLRCIPNLVLMAPADEAECRQLLCTGFAHNGPAAVRYPRGCGPGVVPDSDLVALPLGKGEIRRQGSHAALLAFGSPLQAALQAGQKLGATVANMRFIKPLDEELVVQLAAQHGLLVTLEENALAGGAGSAVRECLAQNGINVPVISLGLADRFVEQGERDTLLAAAGLSAEAIVERVSSYLNGQNMDIAQTQLIS